MSHAPYHWPLDLELRKCLPFCHGSPSAAHSPPSYCCDLNTIYGKTISCSPRATVRTLRQNRRCSPRLLKTPATLLCEMGRALRSHAWHIACYLTSSHKPCACYTQYASNCAPRLRSRGTRPSHQPPCTRSARDDEHTNQLQWAGQKHSCDIFYYPWFVRASIPLSALPRPGSHASPRAAP